MTLFTTTKVTTEYTKVTNDISRTRNESFVLFVAFFVTFVIV